jgi:hypothetical protein
MRTGKGGEHPIGDTICLAPPFVTNEEQLESIYKNPARIDRRVRSSSFRIGSMIQILKT